MATHNWTTQDIPSQKGKTILITGANSGIGLEAATVLAGKGAKVILTSRNAQKGQEAINTIKQQNPSADVEVMGLDLADFESIKLFSKQFHQKVNRLDVLINNAGIMHPKERELSKQGFESQFATNHLGHFLLTGLLLDLLKAAPSARVATQSSVLHKKATGQSFDGDIHFDDINFDKDFNTQKAYAQSKLANILFGYELDKQFKKHGISAISTVAHPGYTATNLQRNSGIMGRISNLLVAQKVEMGALPILRAATDPTLTGGEYLGPTKMNEFKGYPEIVRSNDRSYDQELAKRLWTLSESLTNYTYSF